MTHRLESGKPQSLKKALWNIIHGSNEETCVYGMNTFCLRLSEDTIKVYVLSKIKWVYDPGDKPRFVPNELGELFYVLKKDIMHNSEDVQSHLSILDHLIKVAWRKFISD